jgi:hypothetical protein
MTERDTEAAAQRKGEQQSPEAADDRARHCGRRHLAGGEGTMDEMLNEALGRAARQLKIDPQTGMVLPSPPLEAGQTRESEPAAATGPPAPSGSKSKTGAGADAEPPAPPTPQAEQQSPT